MVLVPKEHWYIILRIFRIEFFGISETYIGTFVDKHLEPQWFNYLNEIILFADLEQNLILQHAYQEDHFRKIFWAELKNSGYV